MDYKVKKWQLDEGFELRTMTKNEFDFLVNPLRKDIFANQLHANINLFYSEAELAATAVLFENTKALSTVRYGLFNGEGFTSAC